MDADRNGAPPLPARSQPGGGATANAGHAGQVSGLCCLCPAARSVMMRRFIYDRPRLRATVLHSNAAEALQRLGEIKKAKVSLSKYIPCMCSNFLPSERPSVCRGCELRSAPSAPTQYGDAWWCQV